MSATRSKLRLVTRVGRLCENVTTNGPCLCEKSAWTVCFEHWGFIKMIWSRDQQECPWADGPRASHENRLGW